MARKPGRDAIGLHEPQREMAFQIEFYSPAETQREIRTKT
jgi:hypothetical protein